MPEPAGTGLSRRSLPAALAPASASPSTAPASWRSCPRSRPASRTPRRARAEHRAAERVPRRRRRQPVRARPGRRPDLPPPAPEARRCATAARSPRTRACAGTRRSTRSPTCTPRARSPSCPPSATPTPTSRTSPRATSGRSARWTPHLRTGWLGRVLDRVGSPDNPLQGVSLDGQLAPVARHRAQPGRGDRQARGLRLLDARRVGPGRGARRARVHAASAARCSARSDPAVAQAARAAAFAGGVRDALAPLGVGRQARLRARRRLPADLRRVPEAARRLRGDARRRPADPRRLDPRARRLGHARQPGGDAAEEPPARRSTRCSPSSATSRRAGSPTACSTLVWSEFGRRAAENGSGTDHGAAGVGFLDRHARRRAG